MPSSPGYVRDYKQEARTESPERKKQRAMRNRARQMAEEYYGKDAIKGKDVDHIRALSKGGGNTLTNLRLTAAGLNRSYSRTSSGAMKSETSKKEARR